MASAIVIILNIVFFALIILGFFIGVKRGLEYSLLHLGFMVVSFLLAVLLTPSISKLFLAVKVGGKTLSALVLDLLGGAATVSSSLKQASLGAVSTILAPIVFVLVCIISYLIFELAYQLIVRLWLKKKDIIKKNHSHRFYGSIFGVIEMFFVVAFMLMPLTSLCSTANAIIKGNPEAEQTANKTSISTLANKYVPSVAKDVLNKYSSSPMGLIITFGGLDNGVYDSISSLKVGNKKYSINGDLKPFIALVDDVVQSGSQYYNNYEQADTEALKQSIDKLIDSPFHKFVGRVLNEFIENKDSIVPAFKLINAYNIPLIQTVDALEERLESTPLNEYLKDNLESLVDAFDSMAKDGGFKELMSSLNGGDILSILNGKIMGSFADALQIIFETDLMHDIYPLFHIALDKNLPIDATNFVKMEYLQDYEQGKVDFVKLFRFLGNLGDIESGDSTLLKEITTGNKDFTKHLLENENASDLIKKLVDIACLRDVPLNTLGEMDEQIIKILREISGHKISDYQFESTIDFYDQDQQDIVLKAIYDNPSDFVSILKLANDDLSSSSLAKFMNLIKEDMLKHYDSNKHESSSIFNNAFENMLNFFSGKISTSDSNLPAFDEFEQFNAKLSAALETVEDSTDENEKLLHVDFEEILKNLI